MVSTPSSKPETRPQEPAAEGEYADSADCHRSVVERVAGDGVDGG